MSPDHLILYSGFWSEYADTRIWVSGLYVAYIRHENYSGLSSRGCLGYGCNRRNVLRS
jgi:hypothetical protein